MRVIKALDLVPEGVDLLAAIGAYLFERGKPIDQLAAAEDGHLKLAGGKIIDRFLLPCSLGVKNRQVLAVIDGLVIDAHIVGNGLAGVVAVEAVELFKVGVRDLTDIFGNFDLRLDRAVLVFDGDKLINTAEDRLGARGDQPLTDAEHVDLRALAQEVLDKVFIQRV